MPAADERGSLCHQPLLLAPNYDQARGRRRAPPTQNWGMMVGTPLHHSLLLTYLLFPSYLTFITTGD